jgi:hypothetical protein
MANRKSSVAEPGTKFIRKRTRRRPSCRKYIRGDGWYQCETLDLIERVSGRRDVGHLGEFGEDVGRVASRDFDFGAIALAEHLTW